MIRYRAMNTDDYDSIISLWEILGSTNSYDDSPEGLSRFLKRNPNTCFVAEDDGIIVGTILAGNDGRRGFLYHVAVSEKYRKKGTGTHLVELAMKALEKEGIDKVALVVFDDNKMGNEFWEKQGFTVRNDLVYRNKYTDLHKK